MSRDKFKGGKRNDTRRPSRTNQERSGFVTIYGVHPAMAAILNKNRTIHKVMCLESMADGVRKARAGFEIEIVTRDDLELLVGKGINHQGIAVHCSKVFNTNLGNLDLTKEQSILVLLDSVTDVANIGNIVRSSAAFGVDAIIYTKNNVPDVASNEVIAKTSAGGIDTLDVVEVSNLSQAIKVLQDDGYYVVGLDGNGKFPLSGFFKKYNLPKVALVLGSEGSGLRELTIKNCDFLVNVPISERMESLNVANACAVALYEYFSTIF